VNELIGLLAHQLKAIRAATCSCDRSAGRRAGAMSGGGLHARRPFNNNLRRIYTISNSDLKLGSQQPTLPSARVVCRVRRLLFGRATNTTLTVAHLASYMVVLGQSGM
jgi:hypothetical protein